MGQKGVLPSFDIQELAATATKGRHLTCEPLQSSTDNVRKVFQHSHWSVGLAWMAAIVMSSLSRILDLFLPVSGDRQAILRGHGEATRQPELATRWRRRLKMHYGVPIWGKLGVKLGFFVAVCWRLCKFRRNQIKTMRPWLRESADRQTVWQRWHRWSC